MSIKAEFINYLSSTLSQSFANTELISENLLSPFVLNLKPEVIEKIQQQIKEIYQLRNWSSEHLSQNFDKTQLPRSQNLSVCTSYDFHLTENNELKLIEVNTNAAFLAMGALLNSFLKNKVSNTSHPATNLTLMPSGWQNFDEQQIIAMFENELKLLNITNKKIYILDEKPSEQRLYIEFLVFKSLFEKYGYACEIIDISEINKVETGSLIYNRYTDFYLNEKKSKTIKQLFIENKIYLSPSPWEYFLIADKQRLFDWTQQTETHQPSSLLKIYDLTLANQEEVWANRKNLFFKPKSSFGSKQVYKGHGLSRKVFENAFKEGFIAQELAPPQEVDVKLNDQIMKFKFDLRCFAYADQLQLVVARLYQGQTTNLQTFGGGFAAVKFDFQSTNVNSNFQPGLQNSTHSTESPHSSSTHYTLINQ